MDTEELQEINEQTDDLQPRPPQKRRIWLKLLLFFVILLVVLQVAFWYLANPILKHYISDAVYTESKGLYSVDFDRIRISLGRKKVYITKLNILPNINLYNKLNSNNSIDKALYRIKIDEIQIHSADIWKWYNKQVVELNSIEIIRPELRILGLPKKLVLTENQKYDAIHKDLFPAISPYLKALSVKTISVNEGFFDLFLKVNQKKHATVVNQLNIVLYDFYLDAKNFRERTDVFYSKSLDFKINNYKLFLADSVHVFKARSLKVSSGDSILHAYGVSLAHRNNLSEKELAARKKDFYDVRIPEFHIQGFDINHAFFEKEIHINKVLLDEPELNVYKFGTKNISNDSIKLTSDLNLYKLIEGKLKVLGVDTFKLFNAAFAVHSNISGNKPNYSVDELSVELNNFLIDSASEKRTDKLLYADDIDFYLRNYYMKLKDGIHQLTADELFISTKQSKIFANNVRLSPAKKKKHLLYQNKTAYRFYIPQVQLLNINLVQMYNSNTLPISKLRMISPSVNIDIYRDSTDIPTEKEKRKIASGEDLANLFSDYLSQMTINKISLENAKFGLKQYFKLEEKIHYTGDLALNITDFRIDPSANYGLGKIFYAGGLNLDFKDYDMVFTDGLHNLHMDRFKISTIDSTIAMRNLRISPMLKDSAYTTLKALGLWSLFKLDLNSLDFKGVDIAGAYYNEKIMVDTILFDRPNFEITSYPNLRPTVRDTGRIARRKQLKKLFRSFFVTEPEQELLVLPINKQTANNQTFKVTNTGLVFINKNNTDTTNYVYSVLPIQPITACKVSTMEKLLVKETPKAIVFKLRKPQNTSDTLTFKRMYLNKVSEVGQIKALIHFYKDIIYTQNDHLSKPDELKVMYMADIDTLVIKYDSTTTANIFEKTDTTTIIGHVDELEATSDFFDLIGKYMAHAQIGNLILRRGSMEQIKADSASQETMTRIGDFSMNLQGFYMNIDSVQDNNRLLFSDEADVFLADISIKLKDKIHHVYADKLYISSVNKEVFAENLSLKSSEKLNLKNLKRLQYDFSFPRIQLTGIDIQQAYMNNQLKAEKLKLYRPKIQITGTKKIFEALNTPFPDKEVPKLPKGLKAIDVENIAFDSGILEYYSYTTNGRKRVLRTEISANMDSYFADSTVFAQYNQPNNTLGLDYAQITLSNTELLVEDSIHQLSVNKIELDMYNRSAVIGRMAYYPVSMNDTMLHLKHFNRSSIYQLNANNTIIRDIDLNRLMNEKVLNFGEADIRSLDIEVKSFKQLQKPKDYHWVETDIYPLFSKIIPEIKIDKLKLSNGNILYELRDSTIAKQTKIEDIKLTATTFFVNDTIQVGSSLLNYVQDADVTIKGFDIPLSDSLYRFGFDKILFSTQGPKLGIYNMVYEPIYDKYEYTLLAQKSYVGVTTSYSEINKFDYLNALHNRIINAEELTINGAFVSIFRDIASEVNPVRTTQRKLLQDYIMEIPYQFVADSVLIKNTHFVFEELDEEQEYPGMINMHNINGSVINLTNSPTQIALENLTRGNIRTDLMQSGYAILDFSFFIDDPQKAFRAEGKLSTMNIADFNRYTVPNVGAAIPSGKLKSGFFTLIADDSLAQGGVRLRYNDLKINVLKSSENDSTLNNRAIFSWFANSLVRSNNPKNGFFRKGVIYAVRDTSNNMFSYWINALLSGITSTAAFNSKAQKKEMRKENNYFKLQKQLRKQQEKIAKRLLDKQTKEEIRTKREEARNVKKLEKMSKKNKEKPKENASINSE